MGKSLDQRGDIAAAQLAVYVPFLAIAAVLTLRHGFSRQAGWVLLVIVSLIRIVGSATHIASELAKQTTEGLVITYVVLDAAGLSPLLIATLGFLGTVAQGSFDHRPLVPRALRLLGLVGTAAIALIAAGGATVATASSPSDLTQGATLRHAGAILYAVLYAFIFAVHIYFYIGFEIILPHRRTLLVGISAALPFLLVRVVFSVLSAYAPAAAIGFPATKHTALTKFSSETGSWQIFLVMSVLMEIIVMIIYITVGLTVRLKDDPVGEKVAYSPDVEMSHSGGGGGGGGGFGLGLFRGRRRLFGRSRR
ncbi:hypothetical protein EUX98_g5908 [Antrodiella citrinella]|uniref:DUF7702 domain-containing protein n=1 Tax=Antrodiella citrinella TaxID=2447956 RepID=A0A4S4MRA7_9APHY|nr:hypothetical protein EUX98_g5908 [Antrodiella citrinella]